MLLNKEDKMDKIFLDEQNYLKIKIDGDQSKPKIIFSNSLGSDLSMWDPQVEYLKNDFHIIRYDKRGHGESSPVEGPYTCLLYTSPSPRD